MPDMWCCFFCKQKTAYEMRISDWSSDVCSSDLLLQHAGLDLIEPVRAVALADDGEDALAAGLVGGQEVAHAARRGDGGHPLILPGRAARPRPRDQIGRAHV